MVGDIRSQLAEDLHVVPLYLSVALWMVCRCEVVLDQNYLACVDKELRYEAVFVVCYEFRLWTIVKDLDSHEV